MLGSSALSWVALLLIAAVILLLVVVIAAVIRRQATRTTSAHPDQLVVRHAIPAWRARMLRRYIVGLP